MDKQLPLGTKGNTVASGKEMRVNRAIRAAFVRLINENAVMEGVVPLEEALRKARNCGLDLIEVDPNGNPPVCKIVDYGRLKYQNQKKKSLMRKKQQVVILKEIQLRPGVHEHDYKVKLNKAKKFLGEGNKVKFSLQFAGREMMHQELGINVIKRAIEDLKELGAPEEEPKFEGRRIIVVVSVLKSKTADSGKNAK